MSAIKPAYLTYAPDYETVFYNSELLRLNLSDELDSGDLDRAFNIITESVAHTLNSDRASIWLYDSDGKFIICKNQYNRDENQHSSGQKLETALYPGYFRLLRSERVVATFDALNDPATKEFKQDYTIPNKVKSLLDVPIRLNGKSIGVVCVEFTKAMRESTEAEKSFAVSISNITAKSIMASERIQALEDLASINYLLERSVESKTKELEEQKQITFHASKMAALGELAGCIAHEINNPLTVILGKAFIINSIARDNKIQDDMFQTSVDSIIQTSERISKIMRGLKFFSRESNQDEMAPAKVSDIIEETLLMCRARFKMHDFEIKVINPNPQIEVKCQSVSISQAILNLLNNSFDAIHDKYTRWIRLEVETTSDFVDIKIIDSGKGIPCDLKEKIFNRFFTTKPVGKGTGLGLPIVSSIMERHNGRILIDADCSNTCFVLRLPRE
ncbi:GAF domain-containing sensor histidine kinase [Peredibacter starrii]|uniref:histidine kinase n=1 Tax=Peredibacter starrii TaxID=28202 RepID=A0AAX4HP74_9BACT|nr:ATP-binding protein [Peredibacter starrii]WPU65062.1 ATP-binding protein [Peredibacter starrii]